jgi:hypothetical protein
MEFLKVMDIVSADLAGARRIEVDELAESVQYRVLDRSLC